MKSSLQFLLFQLPFDWRPPARFIVSVAVIGAITAGMTEGIFELMLRYPSHVPRSMLEVLKEYYYEEDQAFIQYLPDCSKYDDELTYTLRPGSCRFIGREFDTVVNANSLGGETMRTRCTHPKSLFLETPLLWDGASMMRIRSLSALKRGLAARF